MWVPCPAGYSVVDNGGPNEHEDNAGEHSAALCDGADSKSNPVCSISLGLYTAIVGFIDVRDCGKHALVNSEEKIRDPVAAHGWCG